nr:MAG TPA: Large Terminase [Caudoviricetes sp.]
MDEEVVHFDGIRESKAYQYAIDCISDELRRVGKYVKKMAQDFLDMCDDNENSKYYINQAEYEQLEGVLKLINMFPRKSAYDALAKFQWFFLVNLFCVRRKDNSRRRFQYAVLLIGRKNGKSILSALILLILMVTGERNSEFYSCAPDKELSGMVKKEMSKLIDNSPAIKHHFKALRAETRCIPTNSIYVPLAFSENRMDGRLATGYVVDEVGALRTNYPIQAMQSSQITLPSKFGVLISTAYEKLENPMVSEVNYCKKVLDKVVEDDTVFALIYEPDDYKEWETDEALYQANPLAHEDEITREALFEKRKKVFDKPEDVPNFKTKHLNIFIDGDELEPFVDMDTLRKGRIDEFDWYGREVYVGVDMSMSDDNTAVAMVTYDDELDRYVTKVHTFIPKGKMEEKIRKEKINYESYVRQGICTACDDAPNGENPTISYRMVEDYIANLSSKYGVTIKSITYDRYNAISSMQKMEELGYVIIEQNQWGSWLHNGTKMLREDILNGKFAYETNALLEHNFKSAQLVYDADLKMKIDKKKSRANAGKIDGVDAIINIFCTIHTEEVSEKSAYEDRGLLVLDF